MPKISTQRVTIGPHTYHYDIYYTTKIGGFFLHRKKNNPESEKLIDLLESMEPEIDLFAAKQSEAEVQVMINKIIKDAEDEDYHDEWLMLITANAPGQVANKVADHLGDNSLKSVISTSFHSKGTLSLKCVPFVRRTFNQTGRILYIHLGKSHLNKGEEREGWRMGGTTSYPGSYRNPENDIIIPFDPAIPQAIKDFWEAHDELIFRVFCLVFSEQGREKLKDISFNSSRLLESNTTEEVTP